VSADIDAENRARAKKPAPRVKKTAKRTRQRTGSTLKSKRSRSPVGSGPAVVPAAVMHQPVPPWQPTYGRMVAGFGVAAIAIAMIAFPRYPTAGAADSDPTPDHRDTATVVAPSPPSTATSPAPLAKAVPAPRVLNARDVPPPTQKPVVTNRKPEPVKRVTTMAAVSAVDHALEPESATTKPDASGSVPAAPSPAPSGGLPSPVTITGCLEISFDGDEFRLADTEGADAPKSRSWRSGFLKKRSAPLSLVGAPDPLALKKGVGRRVAATGQLAGRELTMSSFRVVSPSCN
jgi:hypothetical protein